VKRTRRRPDAHQGPTTKPLVVQPVEQLRAAHEVWARVARFSDGQPQRRAIAIERTLRALFAAILANDDGAFRALEKVARGNIARIARGNTTLEGFSLFDPHGDKRKGRPAAIAALVKALEGDAKALAPAHDVAETFLVSALGSRMRSILVEHDVVLPSRDDAARRAARAHVMAAFAALLDRTPPRKKGALGDRLLVAGYQALGLPKAIAESLKDSLRKREERGATQE
jgi:hypothetical protein